MTILLYILAAIGGVVVGGVVVWVVFSAAIDHAVARRMW